MRFVGAVVDVRPHLAQATVAALTSPYEGPPNALLEAMAAGRPVVASDVGGISEIVSHGRQGMLVEPTDRAVEEAPVYIYLIGRWPFAWVPRRAPARRCSTGRARWSARRRHIGRSSDTLSPMETKPGYS